jgi:hypothetical protein
MVDPPTTWSYTPVDAITAPLETVLEIGCRAANGQNTPATNTIEKIWAVFVNERPTGVVDAHGNRLLYWGGGQNDPNQNRPGWGRVTDLLAVSDGPCGAWARLLVEVLRTQGVPAYVFGIKPDPAVVGNVDGFIVNSSDGQGVGGSATAFNDHAIVELTNTGGNAVLDPSYGKWFASELDWEKGSIKEIVGLGGDHYEANNSTLWVKFTLSY